MTHLASLYLSLLCSHSETKIILITAPYAIQGYWQEQLHHARSTLNYLQCMNGS